MIPKSGNQFSDQIMLETEGMIRRPMSSWPGSTRPSIVLEGRMRGSSPRMTIREFPDSENIVFSIRYTKYLKLSTRCFRRQINALNRS